MKLIVIILLSSTLCVLASDLNSKADEGALYSDWIIRYFSPEGAMMFDKINRPRRTPRHEYYSGPSYARESAHLFLNSLDLGDTESEDEADELVRTGQIVDRFEVAVSGQKSKRNWPCKTKISDLNEELFEAALESGNAERVSGLIQKKKHLLLTAEQKANAFKSVLWCGYRDPATYGKIFKLLLDAQFYPKDIDSSQTYFPLDRVLNEPLLYQPFLDYDENFFIKQQKVLSMPAYKTVEFIMNCKYTEAKASLRLGYDPKITLVSERNPLDWALDTPRRKLTANEERDRQDLIRILRKDYGMEPSLTIKNLKHIIRVEKNRKRAINLIQRGGVQFQDSSHVDLLDSRLDAVYMDQLIDEIAQNNLIYIDDDCKREILDQAVDKARALRNSRDNEQKSS